MAVKRTNASCSSLSASSSVLRVSERLIDERDEGCAAGRECRNRWLCVFRACESDCWLREVTEQSAIRQSVISIGWWLMSCQLTHILYLILSYSRSQQRCQCSSTTASDWYCSNTTMDSVGNVLVVSTGEQQSSKQLIFDGI